MEEAERLVVETLEEVYGRGFVALDRTGHYTPASRSRTVEVTEPMVMEAIHTHPASLVLNELFVVEGHPGALGKDDEEFLDLVSDYLRLTLQRLDFEKSKEDRDRLTSLAGPLTFDTILDALLIANARVSIILLDLDNFSRFNTEHGQSLGDQRLQDVSKTLQELVGVNPLFRLHSDEFAVLLPDTEVRAASEVAEQVCGQLAVLYPNTTASIGVACCADRQGGKRRLLSAAKQALHVAWQEGGNRVLVSVASSPTDAP